MGDECLDDFGEGGGGGGQVIRYILGMEWTSNIIHAITTKTTESYNLQCYRSSAVSHQPSYKQTVSHKHHKGGVNSVREGNENLSDASR